MCIYIYKKYISYIPSPGIITEVVLCGLAMCDARVYIARTVCLSNTSAIIFNPTKYVRKAVNPIYMAPLTPSKVFTRGALHSQLWRPQRRTWHPCELMLAVETFY